jgi:hypothetical protein
MAEIKTKPTPASANAFLASVEDPQRREDAKALTELMARVTGAPAVMWGPAIIGFGERRYDLAGGKQGQMMRVGFSPRTANLALYVSRQFDGAEAVIARLGKTKSGKGCLYVGKLSEVDVGVLEEFVAKAWAHAAP